MLFVLSVVFLFLVILFYPKSEKKEDLFAQVTLAVLTIMEAHTLWGYITLELLDIGFELSYYASYNTSFALIILLYWVIVKGRKVQKFSAKPHMWITAGLLLAVTVFIGVWRYGPRLNLFAYCSADSANHLSYIEKIFQYGDLTGLDGGRYFLHLNEALLFKIMTRWVQPMSYYRVFLLCELGFFFLSGAVFYVLVNKYMETKQGIIAGVLFVFLYVFGYPLNNLLYGYEYLGASVTIVAHIMYLLERFTEQKKIRWDVFFMIILSCFAMYHCYSLLFIGVLVGIGVVFLVHLVKRPTVLKGIIFLVGVSIICIKIEPLYAYWEIMVGILETDAAMYRDLWSNALWMLPFLLIGITQCVKNRKKDIAVWMLAGILGTMGVFLWYMWERQVGSYYYYKFYFLLWLPVLYITYIGIVNISQRYGKGIVIYFVTVGLLVMVSGIGDTRQSEKGSNTETYLDVYTKNWQTFWGKEANMDEQRQELFYAAAQKVAETGGVVPYIGSWEVFWSQYYYAITNQSKEWRDKFIWFEYTFNYWLVVNGKDKLVEAFDSYLYDELGKIEYVLVQRNSQAYWGEIGYFSSLEVVYENKFGFLLKR